MALDETFYGAPDSSPLSALDAGQANIDWNGILKGVIDVGGQILKAKSGVPVATDKTPVPATSPTQVAPAQMIGISPRVLMYAGVAAVALYLVLRK